MQTYICSLDDITDGQAMLKKVAGLELILIRKRQQLFAYINSCPHLGVPLNWEPDRFLDNSGEFIRCANHGALFDIEQGKCLQGPCAGDKLQAVMLEIIGQQVFTDSAGLPG